MHMERYRAIKNTQIKFLQDTTKLIAPTVNLFNVTHSFQKKKYYIYICVIIYLT